MGFCGECGSNVGSAKFCGECGNAIGGAAPAPVQKKTWQPPPPAQKSYAPKPSSVKPAQVDLFAGPNKNTSFQHDGHYGLSAETKMKIASKYNPALERDAIAYLKRKTGQSINGDLQSGLKSGVVLCMLANSIKSNSAKFKASNMPFIQMENISHFLAAVTGPLGMRTSDSFQTVDLFEGKNMVQVVNLIMSLKAKYP